METVTLLLNLGNTALELWQDSRKDRHKATLLELKKRYMDAYNQDQQDFNTLDQLEFDIRMQLRYLIHDCSEARESETKDLSK